MQPKIPQPVEPNTNILLEQDPSQKKNARLIKSSSYIFLFAAVPLLAHISVIVIAPFIPILGFVGALLGFQLSALLTLAGSVIAVANIVTVVSMKLQQHVIEDRALQRTITSSILIFIVVALVWVPIISDHFERQEEIKASRQEAVERKLFIESQGDQWLDSWRDISEDQYKDYIYTCSATTIYLNITPTWMNERINYRSSDNFPTYSVDTSKSKTGFMMSPINPEGENEISLWISSEHKNKTLDVGKKAFRTRDCGEFIGGYKGFVID